MNRTRVARDLDFFSGSGPLFFIFKKSPGPGQPWVVPYNIYKYDIYVKNVGLFIWFILDRILDGLRKSIFDQN